MIDLRLGDCLEVMKTIPDNSVDLVITSPPYDKLRDYKGFTFNFEGIAKELLRIIKSGGVVVWIVADETVNGSESGTSFSQALYFKEIGFNLHDTMIWSKPTFTATGALKVRYAQTFEYMFILTKGKIKTFNPIKDRINKSFGSKLHAQITQRDGSKKPICNKGRLVNKIGQRFNVWFMSTEVSNLKRCGHPAPFPEQLTNDHILSWSNEGDTILDPMMGSGTVGKMAKLNKRNFIGIEISPEYFKIAERRINNTSENLL